MGVFSVKGIYSSGMVLQRNAINCIFGTAEAGSSVRVIFKDNGWTTECGSDGAWKILFNPGEAGGPFSMTVKNGSEQFEYSDVYVGEVWLLSGQSNAELQMSMLRWSYRKDFEAPKNNLIRMINIPIAYSFAGECDYVQSPKWICASPETLALMSGAGYFFAKKLSSELNVPVGIINASQGGSPIASWVSKETILNFCDREHYCDTLRRWENPVAVEEAKVRTAQALEAWQDSLNEGQQPPAVGESEGWETCAVPGTIDTLKRAGLVWVKKEIQLSKEEAEIFNSKKTWLWLGAIIDSDVAYVNGVQVGTTYCRYPPRRYPVPAGTLKEGTNVIAVKIQKFAAKDTVTFTAEKTYALFTEDVVLPAAASRCIEPQPEPFIPEGGVCIDLSGTWQMKVAKEADDRPPELFFEWQPTALYNAMLAPCFNYAIAGALWYQGESDTGHPDEYSGMLESLVDLWHRKFVYGKKDFPFIVVQLPNWSDGQGESYTTNALGWVPLRKAQSDAVSIIPRAGLAVTIDAGEWNDLHPEKKETIGTRLAYEALRLAYGRSEMPVAPKAVCCKREGETITVTFDCKNCTLATYNGESPVVRGFYIEVDGEKQEVPAELVGDNSVRVTIPSAQTGVQRLCYLWADSPRFVDLYGKSGDILLPAEPFSFEF